jgi:hypothetical protein
MLIGSSAFSACLVAVYGAPCTASSAVLNDGGTDKCGQDECHEVLPDGGLKGHSPDLKQMCELPDGGIE